MINGFTNLGKIAAKRLDLTLEPRLSLPKLRAFIEMKTGNPPNSIQLGAAYHAFKLERANQLTLRTLHRRVL